MKMKRMKSKTALLLVCLLFVTAVLPVYASDLADAQEQIAQTIENIRDLEQELQEKTGEILESESMDPQQAEALQSQTEECMENMESLISSADSFKETASQMTQKTGSIVDTAGSMGGTSGVSDIFRLLQVQLQQSADAVRPANDQMQRIQAKQQLQKATSEMLIQARETAAVSADTGENIPMPDEMKAFFDENGLPASEDWVQNTSILESFQDQLAMQVQEDMMYIQDFMANYNNFMQDTNHSVFEWLKSLNGQMETGTIYGSTKTVLVTAPVVTAGLIGLAAGLLLMYAILRKKRLPKNQ